MLTTLGRVRYTGVAEETATFDQPTAFRATASSAVFCQSVMHKYVYSMSDTLSVISCLSFITCEVDCQIHLQHKASGQAQKQTI